MVEHQDPQAETPQEVIDRLRTTVHDMVPHLVVGLEEGEINPGKPTTAAEVEQAAQKLAALKILDQVDVLLDQVTPKD